MSRKQNPGLVIVNTGNGKGKTTAAIGVLMRAYGQGQRVCMLQFIKAETGRWGEVRAAQEFGIEWHKLGNGFIKENENTDKTRVKAAHGWKLAQEKIASNEYDLIVLDEFTYLFLADWINAQEAVTWLKNNKPDSMNLVITGRYAPQELIEYADTVTDMQKLKHAFDQGRKAQRGIEF